MYFFLTIDYAKLPNLGTQIDGANVGNAVMQNSYMESFFKTRAVIGQTR